MKISLSATQKQIKDDLKKLIEKKKRELQALEPVKSNPTVAPNYWGIKGQLEALSAIEEYVKGNKMYFNIL